MLRNVCFRTHVIPSANSNFDPARGLHSTTAPFCFEACAPTAAASNDAAETGQTGLGLPLLIEWPCVPAVHNAANV